MIAARLLIAASAMAALPAAAHEPPARKPGTTAAGRIAASRYAIDPHRSEVSFTVHQLGFTAYRGTFAKLSGFLRIETTPPRRTSLAIDIPIRNLVTSVRHIDAQLLGPSFFDAARFPFARFESTSIRRTGARARIAGRLTLKGITQPVILDARFFEAAGKRIVGVEATATIRRSAFGISGAIPLIPDMMPLAIALTVEPTPPKRRTSPITPKRAVTKP